MFYILENMLNPISNYSYFFFKLICVDDRSNYCPNSYTHNKNKKLVFNIVLSSYFTYLNYSNILRLVDLVGLELNKFKIVYTSQLE